jgi:ATP-dependent DNA ligase
VRTKCLNRQEFVLVAWTDLEGSRSSIGSLVLGYHTDEGKLIYAGRVGTGMTQSELRALLKKRSSACRGDNDGRRTAAERRALADRSNCRGPWVPLSWSRKSSF